PGLLEQAAAAQYAGASAPAGVPGPEVFLEAGAAVGFFQRRTDAVLQLAQVPLYLLGMIGLHGCSLYGRMSAPVRASRMVVGRASPPSGPTTMSSSSSAKICRTRSGVRAGLPPLRLALVDTSAPPKTRHSAAASGCAVTRTAMLSRPPVSQGGTPSRAGTIQVTGPGQLSRTVAAMAAGSGAMNGASWASSAAIRITPLASGRCLSASRRAKAAWLSGSQPSP